MKLRFYSYGDLALPFAMIGVILSCLVPLSVLAQQNTLPYLDIGPNTYSLSLGGSTFAVPSGPSDLFANPSLIAGRKHHDIDLSYTLWISQSQIREVAFSLPVHNQTLGIGLLSSDVNTHTSGVGVQQQDIAIAGTYARHWGAFSAGLTGLYLFEEYNGYRTGGYAVTAAANFALAKDLNISTGLRNIGHFNEIRNASGVLPTTITAGVYSPLISVPGIGSYNLPVTVSLSGDIQQPLNDGTVIQNTHTDIGFTIRKKAYCSTGIMIRVDNLVELRAGYRFVNESARKISLGTGIVTQHLDADFAYIPFTAGYGNVYSFGIRYHF